MGDVYTSTEVMDNLTILCDDFGSRFGGTEGEKQAAEFMRDKLQLLLIVFIPYFVQMLIAFIKYGKTTAFHTYFAKLSAVVKAMFILIALFLDPVLWLFYTVLVIGVLETFEEITLIFMHDRWTEDVKGIYWAWKKKKKERRTKRKTEI